VIAEVDDPQPAPGHAVVEVAAFSINRGETYQLEHPRSSWRPGKDLAGIVVAAAPDGSGPPVGTRVVGHADEGAWAQRALVSIDRLAELPDEVSFVTAAALPLAGLTALRLLRVTGPLPSRKVLLTGASGGVGHYFTELASSQGALLTAVTGSSDRGRRLIELGAVEVVRDVSDAVGPFDIAIESIGGQATRAAWHRLEPHGLLIWIGQASRTPPELDYFDWDGAMSVTIRKFNYLDSSHSEADDLATLVRLVSTGRLHPELGLVEDWARTGEAIGQLLDRKVRGNAVLTIAA
jgi:NADPH:quinone reductase-like Zn-dependent oxidoreductase